MRIFTFVVMRGTNGYEMRVGKGSNSRSWSALLSLDDLGNKHQQP